jgi:hypothetical protein
MARRRKRKEIDASEPLVADHEQEQNERDESPDCPTNGGATDVPGQPEPSAEAEGECEPELDEAQARRLAQ